MLTFPDFCKLASSYPLIKTEWFSWNFPYALPCTQASCLRSSFRTWYGEFTAKIISRFCGQRKIYSVILTTSFYDINQKILTKKVYFQNFSWSQIFIYKLCIVICALALLHRLLYWINSWTQEFKVKWL